MNSKIIKIIIFSLLIIVVYIGFKYYCYLKYKSSDNLELSNVKINGNMTINHTELDEYVTFNNLKFKNVFDGYERFNEESNAYKMVLKNECIYPSIFLKTAYTGFCYCYDFLLCF